MSSNPLRKTTLLRTFLEQLNHAKGYAVPEVALRPQVDGLMRPPTSDEEWKDAVTWLEAGIRQAIQRIPSDFDEELVQWTITERGRVLLQTFPT